MIYGFQSRQIAKTLAQVARERMTRPQHRLTQHGTPQTIGPAHYQLPAAPRLKPVELHDMVGGRLLITEASGYSGTLKYLPIAGNKILISMTDTTTGGWRLCTIPAAADPLTLSNSGLSAETAYKIAVRLNEAGSLELVTAAYDAAQYTKDGIIVLSSDKRLRVIGTVFIDVAGNFRDTQAERYIGNNYNMRPKRVSVNIGTGDTSGGSYESGQIKIVARYDTVKDGHWTLDLTAAAEAYSANYQYPLTMALRSYQHDKTVPEGLVSAKFGYVSANLGDGAIFYATLPLTWHGTVHRDISGEHGGRIIYTAYFTSSVTWNIAGQTFQGAVML